MLFLSKLIPNKFGCLKIQFIFVADKIGKNEFSFSKYSF